jgi:endonuclease YncB( thermonuclease family)
LLLFFKKEVLPFFFFSRQVRRVRVASASRIVAIIGAFALVAAAGGGVTYVLLKAPQTTKPAAESAPPPAPAAAASQPSPPAVDASESAPDIATVDFTPSSAEFTIAKPTAAYVSASPDSPKMYALPPGIGVRATEQSKDGKWLIALTEDGQAAFLPATDLGPYQPNAADAVPSLPETVAGGATVIDTATLSVEGQRIPLFGVTGEAGALADQLQDLLNANGARVTCRLQVESYRCQLPNGIDIARVALYNGAARPGPDASDDYRQQAAAAAAQHKGVWQ